MEAIMDIIQGCSVSKIRDRNAALAAIVPKILSILRSREQKLHGFGDCSVQLTEGIVLSAHPIDAHRPMLSVYDKTSSGIVKVLSLHVTDFPSAVDPNFYLYQGDRAAVLSWRRHGKTPSWQTIQQSSIDLHLDGISSGTAIGRSS